jgi:Flp pilus assembly protein TadG
MGFAGLAVDVGLLWSVKRHMQAATDAAAIAAATQLRNGGSYQSAARDVSGFNGFVHGTGSVTVTVNNPPLSGTYASDASYVEVIVAKPEPSYFMRYLGAASVTVSTRAVAGGASGNYCIYTLEPTASDALHVEGGDSLISSCGVVANSSSSTAITANGSITAPNVGVTGNYTGTINATVTTGVAPMPDPLAGLPAPTVGSCTVTNYSASSGTITLNPGVYCGTGGNAAIALSGSAVVTLNAGMYILKGGGLTMQGNSMLKGTGVTIYNTGTTTTYKPIGMQDGSNIQLTAPTSGTYAGILFFNDRSIPYGTGGGANTFGGGTNSKIEGALYFPTVAVNFSNGQFTSAAYTIVVAKTLAVSINGFTVANNYSSLANGSPIKKSILFE